MPPLRLRLRTLLIAVAIAGIGLAVADHLGRRGEAFRRRAEYYQREARREIMAGMVAGNLPWFANASLTPEQKAARDFHDGLGEYYQELGAKYRRAARYPWLPVEPDPPPPE